MALTPKDQEQLNKALERELSLVEQIKQANKSGTAAGKEYNRLVNERTGIFNTINALQDKLNAKSKIGATAAKKVVDTSKEYSSQLKDIADLSKTAAGFDKKKLQSATQIQGISSLTSRLEQKAVTNNKLIAFWSTSTDRYAGEHLKKAQAYKGVSDKTLGTVAELASFEKDKLVNSQSLGKSGLQALDASYALAASMEAENELALRGSQMSATQRKEIELKVAAYGAAADKAQQEAAHLDLIKSKAAGIAPHITAPFDKMKDALEDLPGGGMLSNILGLDQFGADMQSNVLQSLEHGMNGSIQDGLTHFKGLTGQTKIFGMSLKAAMGPLIVASVIIAAVMMFKELEKTTLEISKNQGVSLKHAQGQHKAAMQAQAMSSNSLANTEEILGAQSALNEAFGNTTSASAEVAMNVSNLSTAFGIAVADAAAVQAQFENMGQSSSEAFQSQALAANLADAAGVAPGKVMKDIASNSKKAARYMGGNVKALTKAAVEAARLGMSLGDMVDISDGLLDIESSITAEFEASVMLGKTINMDKARQLALEGDIAGASKAALEQAGSLADLNAMQPLQRKAIAKAAGMEVGQLMEAAKKQEQLNSLTAEQKKRYEEAGKALEGATLSGEDILAQQEAAAATKQMGAQFDKIKNTLMSSLMPVISAITNIFTSVLSPVLDVIGATFKGMMFALTPVFMIIQGIAKVISTIAPVLKVIAGLFGVIYGIKALIWAGDKISLGYQSAKAAFATGEATTATIINGLKSMGLITDQMAGKALLSNSISSKGIALTENQSAMVKRTSLVSQLKSSAIAAKDWVVAQGTYISNKLLGTEKTKALGTTLKESAIKMKDWVMDKATVAIQYVRNALKTGELGTTIAIGAQKAWQFVKDTATNVMLGGRFILEQGMLAIQFAINAAKTVGNVIAAGGVAPLVAAAGAAIAAAIPAIFTGLGMVPFGLGIPLAFAAVAGLIGLMSSMTSGDDVMSKPSGGSGYGSRTLFGPEGAISFNNKDTIVAGTNLFGNDVVSGPNPKGALRVDDYSSSGGGDMPDPPETMIVDYSSQALKKMGIAVGIGTLASGVMLKLIPQMTFSMNPLAMLGGLMGGAALGAAASSGTEGGEGATLDTIAEKLDLLITAIGGTSSGDSKTKEPVQIVIGNKVIEEISTQMNINKSYTIQHGSGGEEG